MWLAQTHISGKSDKTLLRPKPEVQSTLSGNGKQQHPSSIIRICGDSKFPKPASIIQFPEREHQQDT